MPAPQRRSLCSQSPEPTETASADSRQSIHIGGVCASREPAIVRTVLGSCIAVCLRDPLTRIGGMNHFMLPDSLDMERDSARYGVHAMELLINDCMKLGADRRRFEAKVFGGGHVLRIRETDNNVPQSNIRFAIDFLNTENIPIVAQDVGGYAAREIYFYTDSGRIQLRRLPTSGSDKSALVDDLESEERESRRAQAKRALPADDLDNVTLF